MKELNFFGVYLPPFFGDLALAALLFAPLKWVLDRIGTNRVVWHRPLFDLSLFVCITAAVTLGLRGSGYL
jgi:hypothetical protein